MKNLQKIQEIVWIFFVIEIRGWDFHTIIDSILEKVKT